MDQQLSEPFVGTKSLKLDGVTYPKAGPSLPEPLVPIREVPQSKAASESNPVREALEEQQRLGSEDPAERLIGATDPVDAGEASEVAGSGDVEASTETPANANHIFGASPGADEARRLSFGAKKTLESVVLSQGRDAPERETADSEFSGSLVSVTS